MDRTLKLGDTCNNILSSRHPCPKGPKSLLLPLFIHPTWKFHLLAQWLLPRTAPGSSITHPPFSSNKKQNFSLNIEHNYYHFVICKCYSVLLAALQAVCAVSKVLRNLFPYPIWNYNKFVSKKYMKDFLWTQISNYLMPFKDMESGKIS